MKLVQNNFITKNTSLNIFAYASLTVANNNGTFLPNERETMGKLLTLQTRASSWSCIKPNF